MCYIEITVRTSNGRTFRAIIDEDICRIFEEVYPDAVSYTHLTLPTTPYV